MSGGKGKQSSGGGQAYEAEVSLVQDVAAEGAVEGRGGQELDLGAQIVLASAALLAYAAGEARLERHTVARLQVLDVRADLSDDARALVAKDDGTLQLEGAALAVRIVVHIGTAHAHAADLDHNLVLVRLGERTLLDLELLELCRAVSMHRAGGGRCGVPLSTTAVLGCVIAAAGKQRRLWRRTRGFGRRTKLRSQVTLQAPGGCSSGWRRRAGMQTTPEPKGKGPARPGSPPGPDEGQPGLWSTSPWRAILSYVLGPKQPTDSPNKSPQRQQDGPSLRAARIVAHVPPPATRPDEERGDPVRSPTSPDVRLAERPAELLTAQAPLYSPRKEGFHSTWMTAMQLSLWDNIFGPQVIKVRARRLGGRPRGLSRPQFWPAVEELDHDLQLHLARQVLSGEIARAESKTTRPETTLHLLNEVGPPLDPPCRFASPLLADPRRLADFIVISTLFAAVYKGHQNTKFALSLLVRRGKHLQQFLRLRDVIEDRVQHLVAKYRAALDRVRPEPRPSSSCRSFACDSLDPSRSCSSSRRLSLLYIFFSSSSSFFGFSPLIGVGRSPPVRCRLWRDSWGSFRSSWRASSGPRCPASPSHTPTSSPAPSASNSWPGLSRRCCRLGRRSCTVAAPRM